MTSIDTIPSSFLLTLKTGSVINLNYQKRKTRKKAGPPLFIFSLNFQRIPAKNCGKMIAL